jgi:hypothetical protein
MFPIMLIFLLNMHLTYELYKAFNLNYINTSIKAVVDFRFLSTVGVLYNPAGFKYRYNFSDCAFWSKRTTCAGCGNVSAEQVQYVEPLENHTFLWPLSP